VDNYLAIVFSADEKAFEGLHALWALDEAGDITVHGAAVIHRDRFGRVDVAAKDSDTGLRAVVSVGLGVLLGALARPKGLAASLAMMPGHAAVMAEISEDRTMPIDFAMAARGGVVYRRSKNEVCDASLCGDEFADYLYPYDYEAEFPS
jgi:hypothetical protein